MGTHWTKEQKEVLIEEIKKNNETSTRAEIAYIVSKKLGRNCTEAYVVKIASKVGVARGTNAPLDETQRQNLINLIKTNMAASAPFIAKKFKEFYGRAINPSTVRKFRLTLPEERRKKEAELLKLLESEKHDPPTLQKLNKILRVKWVTNAQN